MLVNYRLATANETWPWRDEKPVQHFAVSPIDPPPSYEASVCGREVMKEDEDNGVGVMTEEKQRKHRLH